MPGGTRAATPLGQVEDSPSDAGGVRTGRRPGAGAPPSISGSRAAEARMAGDEGMDCTAPGDRVRGAGLRADVVGVAAAAGPDPGVGRRGPLVGPAPARRPGP